MISCLFLGILVITLCGRRDDAALECARFDQRLVPAVTARVFPTEAELFGAAQVHARLHRVALLAARGALNIIPRVVTEHGHTNSVAQSQRVSIYFCALKNRCHECLTHRKSMTPKNVSDIRFLRLGVKVSGCQGV